MKFASDSRRWGVREEMLNNRPQIRIGGPLTPVVTQIMVINGLVFILQIVLGLFYPGMMEQSFGLSHRGLVEELKLWQIATYMFLHGGWFHILFNCLALWMFGGELEEIWGSRKFLNYYLLSGVGAGLCIALMNYVIFQRSVMNPVTLGASGAIYAILLAYGMTWPDRRVLLYFVIPIKIKYLVAIFGLIEFFGTLASVSGTGGTISHIGHLGGIVSGFVLMLIYRRKQEITGSLRTKEGVIGRFMKRIRLKRKQRLIEERRRAKEIIDACLEKIAREGMSSLTAKERKDLEWARKHYHVDENVTRH